MDHGIYALIFGILGAVALVTITAYASERLGILTVIGGTLLLLAVLTWAT